ncbi:zinc finger protein 653-like isoform X2 [Acipenser ruthenus]|uniref:zinc finger protein 653-like isoform X2 n=1 Tax=Acipenser ruthenus TaxID=7906 RepID=UPI0027421BCF|nr:zinc finger protein 653-like isoform X2 [Acipenser ruthenus]
MAENSAVKEEATCSVEVTLDRDSVRPVYDYLNRPRGRPRLPDWARTPRRLKGRKKYDARRVYLGETHGLWCKLRRRTPYWSDSEFAQYLLKLEGRYGETYREKYGKQLIWEIYTGKPQVLIQGSATENQQHQCQSDAVSYNPALLAQSDSCTQETDAKRPVCESLGLIEAESSDCNSDSITTIEIQDPAPLRPKRHGQGLYIESDGTIKTFRCPYEGCSQVYVTVKSYRNHVNIVHKKGRTEVCSHPGCGKKFYLLNHLQRHMVTHSETRDFTCTLCDKSFKRKNHLEVHQRTHTGETPLQCQYCGFQCRQRASLNWHMKKKHTPAAVQYDYTCELCGKGFEKAESVKFHKLKSHPESTEREGRGDTHSPPDS